MPSQPGTFTLSLDFELYWGMRDETRLDAYKTNLAGVHQAIPLMLEIFKQQGIHATWATVGFIFFQDTADLLQHLPALKPDYHDPRINPYLHLPDTDRHPNLKPYYYAPELIRIIKACQGQEIASHSFSHYYTDETGASPTSFTADMNAAQQIAQRYGISLKTYVFPRQQYSPAYLEQLGENGIRSFRGNAKSVIYHAPEKHDRYYSLKRVMRFLDSLFNLAGHQTVIPQVYRTCGHTLINIPASRFFYPYCPSPTINQLRLKRIMQGMTHAARKGEIFHLWWHPHNVGANIPENMQRLEQVIGHYHDLQKRYGMKNMNLGEITDACPLPSATIGCGNVLAETNRIQQACATDWTST